MNNGFFIRTSNADTAKELRSIGYKELNKEGKYFVFANANTLTFSDNIDQGTINYTNKLCI